MSDDSKKFFQCEDGDGGATYSVVAHDLGNAKEILYTNGIEFDSDSGKGLRPSDRGSHLTWTEITADRAAQISIRDEDRPDVACNLAQFAIGDWFCSEY